MSNSKTQDSVSRAAAIGLDVFYPIVPGASWIKRLVPLGISTVQLRIKDATDSQIRHDITEAMEICEANRCQLIVNDYWQEAIELGADFVHLGQEDLTNADIASIKSHGLRVGISTHDRAELAEALSWSPDYIALGPVYETKLKAMAWAPQGLERVEEWAALAGSIPLVGIGGLTIDRATGVIAAGARSVSVITDFVNHKTPEERIRAWLSWARTMRVDGTH